MQKDYYIMASEFAKRKNVNSDTMETTFIFMVKQKKGGNNYGKRR